MSHPRF